LRRTMSWSPGTNGAERAAPPSCPRARPLTGPIRYRATSGYCSTVGSTNRRTSGRHEIACPSRTASVQLGDTDALRMASPARPDTTNPAALSTDRMPS
jgi:hypothetical protein